MTEKRPTLHTIDNCDCCERPEYIRDEARNQTIADVEKIIPNLKIYEVWSRRKNVPINSLTNATIDTKTKCVSIEELLDRIEEIKNLKSQGIAQDVNGKSELTSSPDTQSPSVREIIEDIRSNPQAMEQVKRLSASKDTRKGCGNLLFMADNKQIGCGFTPWLKSGRFGEMLLCDNCKKVKDGL